MSVKVTRIEGTKFRAEASGFEIVTGRVDEKTPAEGMSPGGVMVAALGLCTGTRIIEQMDLRGWKAGRLSVNVKIKTDKGLNRATDFDVDIELEADLTEPQLKEIVEEAGRCFVGNTLRNPPRFDICVNLV